MTDRGVGCRCGGGKTACLDDRRTTLAHRRQKHIAVPGFVIDQRFQRLSVDRGEAIVRIHRRGMVAPHDQLFDRSDRLARFDRELRQRTVVVEPQHCGEILFRQRRRGFHGDVAVGIGRVSDHQHLDPAASHGIERLALLDENLRVLEQKILSLHARAARPRADQQRDIGVLECDLGVRSAGHARKKRKRAILELHHDALECRLGLVDRQLQQLQRNRLIVPEHFAASDAEQKAVTDLTGGAGHRHANGVFHRGLLDGKVRVSSAGDKRRPRPR